jgi:hypothetical protein
MQRILEHCDFGLGTFGLDRKGMGDSCSLKVRDCLACGLPTVLGCNDPLLSSDWAAPYLLRIDPRDPDLDATRRFTQRCFDRDRLAKIAVEQLAWPALFRAAAVIPPEGETELSPRPEKTAATERESQR